MEAMGFSTEEPGQPAAEQSVQQAEIDSINEQAWAIRHAEVERAFELSQQALDRSTSGIFAHQPYLKGQSAGLTTQAFLNQDQGHLDLALTQALDALSILETLPNSRVTVDALRVINWIYYFIGDFGAAVDFGLRGLKLARELELVQEQAYCLDALAMVYGASGDTRQAIDSQEEAVRLIRVAGDANLESTILNNLAMNLMEAGQLSAALENGQAGLEIAQKNGWTEQVISILDTLGQIYQRMGDYPRSEQVFREGLQLTGQGKHDLSAVYCLLGLGASLLGQKEIMQAEVNTLKALELATRLGTRPVEVQCHQQLSEIYEQQGSLRQALEHYKRFYQLNQQVFNENSSKRLDILKIVFQMETARRDAEIYRLRTVALQHEVDERQRAETELKRLATLDPLTNLYNRRHFFHLANVHFQQADRFGLPLSAMMIDADYFKLINDQYGHAVGDDVICKISAFIREHLRMPPKRPAVTAFTPPGVAAPKSLFTSYSRPK
jgi:tetratricopeptide (TPR) repeat protein